MTYSGGTHALAENENLMFRISAFKIPKKELKLTQKLRLFWMIALENPTMDDSAIRNKKNVSLNTTNQHRSNKVVTKLKQSPAATH